MTGETIAAIIVRRRTFVALAWILACVLLLPKARRIESVLRVAARVDGSESAAVDEQLANRFQSPFAHSVVLVAAGIPSPQTPVGADEHGPADVILDTLRDATRRFETALRQSHPKASLRWTGQLALNVDLRR